MKHRSMFVLLFLCLILAGCAKPQGTSLASLPEGPQPVAEAPSSPAEASSQEETWPETPQAILDARGGVPLPQEALLPSAPGSPGPLPAGSESDGYLIWSSPGVYACGEERLVTVNGELLHLYLDRCFPKNEDAEFYARNFYTALPELGLKDILYGSYWPQPYGGSSPNCDYLPDWLLSSAESAPDGSPRFLYEDRLFTRVSQETVAEFRELQEQFEDFQSFLLSREEAILTLGSTYALENARAQLQEDLADDTVYIPVSDAEFIRALQSMPVRFSGAYPTDAVLEGVTDIQRDHYGRILGRADYTQAVDQTGHRAQQAVWWCFFYTPNGISLTARRSLESAEALKASCRWDRPMVSEEAETVYWELRADLQAGDLRKARRARQTLSDLYSSGNHGVSFDNLAPAAALIHDCEAVLSAEVTKAFVEQYFSGVDLQVLRFRDSDTNIAGESWIWDRLHELDQARHS